MTNFLYIAMDTSGSMSGERMNTQKAGVAGLLEFLRDNDRGVGSVLLRTFDIGHVDFRRDNLSSIPSGWNELINYVNALPDATGPQTNFEEAMSGVGPFFGDMVPHPFCESLAAAILITDGEATRGNTNTARGFVDAVDGLKLFCFNMDGGSGIATAILDNTPEDGVPVVSGSDIPALITAITGAINDLPPCSFAEVGVNFRDVVVEIFDNGGYVAGCGFQGRTIARRARVATTNLYDKDDQTKFGLVNHGVVAVEQSMIGTGVLEQATASGTGSQNARAWMNSVGKSYVMRITRYATLIDGSAVPIGYYTVNALVREFSEQLNFGSKSTFNVEFALNTNLDNAAWTDGAP